MDSINLSNNQNELKKVKSHYILKRIFDNIQNKRVLYIIKYNKYIQKKLNLSILHYMHFQAKFIVYDSNKIGKEYNDDDDLIFEGEYLNDKRNGNGKEDDTNSGKLIFEGDYLNGERNGKGKEINFNRDITFEGEYLNGKRNGKGIEYHNFNFGKLKCEGEYLNNKRNGKIKEFNQMEN